jgi:hypothetical protein
MVFHVLDTSFQHPSLTAYRTVKVKVIVLVTPAELAVTGRV